MDTKEVLCMINEVIEEVKDEMQDRRPEIQIAAQFAAIRVFQRLNKKYDFKTLDQK